MESRYILGGLAAIAGLLAGCAPGSNSTAARSACTVERLQRTPAPAESLGSLGMPPSHVTVDEIDALAECLAPALDRVMAATTEPVVRRTTDWAEMSKAYRGSEHGMFLQVFANPIAAPSYRLYEKGEPIPLGGTLLKRSFRVSADGQATPFAIFVMERMAPGFSPATNDWRYVVIAPDGITQGQTNGPNAAGVRSCESCHDTARRQDFLLFVPPGQRL